ncbi:hypothetical protein SLS62_010040 [Diatrype stigma]|uniref:Uncharacterized protein n=1 Tax=Diatrype stigma TaxID=117547 RepID=A0AAN9UDT9_9PEZI
MNSEPKPLNVKQNEHAKMPLVVRPVEHADVAQCINIRIASLGSLVIGRPPPYPGYLQQQEPALHEDLDDNRRHRYTHHLKVLDIPTGLAHEHEHEQGVIIAYAKWETYEHRRPDLDTLRQQKQKRSIKQPESEPGPKVRAMTADGNDGLGRLREARQ